MACKENLTEIKRRVFQINGKIDRKELNIMKLKEDTGLDYMAPSNSVEERLVNIWANLLLQEKISVNDNFFDIGGHSLKAARLNVKINKEFNIKMPFIEIFKKPTIKDLAGYIMTLNEDQHLMIKPAIKREFYPLSAAQKRIFLTNHFYDKNISYNMPSVLQIEGDLDLERLNRVFKQLIERHESLRTSFGIFDGNPVQKVVEKIDFSIRILQSYELDGINNINKFIQPFDLSKAPLFRVFLSKIGDKKYVLMMDMHHIISDGTSTKILIQDICKLYDGKEIDEVKVQYKDYVMWSQESFSLNDLNKHKEFWLKGFSGQLTKLTLPFDFARPDTKCFEGANIRFRVNSEDTAALKELAKREKTTLFILLLTIFNAFLSKLSNQEDIIVGTGVSGREHIDLQNVVGLFVNTLALRNFPYAGFPFNEFLKITTRRTIDAFEHQNYQFEDLVEELKIERNLSRNPLFDVMIMFEKVEEGVDGEGIDNRKRTREIMIKPFDYDQLISKFDLTLFAEEHPDEIYLAFEYATRLFKAETIEKFIGYFKQLIKSILQNSRAKISDLNILSETQRESILVHFNDDLYND